MPKHLCTVNAQENHTLSTQRNIQRKYSGGTKEECHSYNYVNAQKNQCTRKPHWMHKESTVEVQRKQMPFR